MVKDFEELVSLCNQELQQREYNTYYYFHLKNSQPRVFTHGAVNFIRSV